MTVDLEFCIETVYSRANGELDDSAMVEHREYMRNFTGARHRNVTSQVSAVYFGQLLGISLLSGFARRFKIGSTLK